MSHRLIMGAVALGVLVLAMALFVPSLIDATQDDAQKTVELTEGSSQNLTERLSLTAHDISSGQSEANVTLENLVTLNRTAEHLNVSETKTLNLSNEDVEVTLDSISDTDEALITATYSPMFGWDAGPRTFVENLDLVLALLGALTILGGIFIGLKP